MTIHYSTHFVRKALFLTCLTLFTGALTPNVFADGTEQLGVPSIAIKTGSGVVTGGVGLEGQPGILNVNVPGAAAVRQVLLYWEGRGGSGDNTIIVDGTTITGALIGGPIASPSFPSRSYRADITSRNLINPGSNSLNVSGLNFVTVYQMEREYSSFSMNNPPPHLADVLLVSKLEWERTARLLLIPENYLLQVVL